MSETTPVPRPLPLVIAHRGASAEAPENTIAAFELALEQGADAIAIDVRLSADEQPVVIAEEGLGPMADGGAPVSGRTVRELKRLDAGGWWSPGFKGQHVQTLQEVLERFRDRTRFWIELGGRPGVEEHVVSMVEIYGVIDRAVVQSPDPAALARVQAMSPEIRLALMVTRQTPAPGMAEPGPAAAISLGRDLVSEEAIGAIRRAGLGCYAWTVDEPAQADRLVDWCIDGIATGRPGAVRARLGRLGCRS